MQQVSIACCFPCELSSASVTDRFGRGARLLSLVAEKIATGGKLSAVAAMIEASVLPRIL